VLTKEIYKLKGKARKIF